MQIVRELFNYLVVMAFCGLAAMLCYFAWVGLDDMFGWMCAVGSVAFVLMTRVNLPVLVGLFYYATNILGWSQAEAVAFALPGLLIIAPWVATGIFGTLMAKAERR